MLLQLGRTTFTSANRDAALSCLKLPSSPLGTALTAAPVATFSVHPTLAHQRIVVHWRGQAPAPAPKVRIVDGGGRVVRTANLPASRCIIQVASLAAGIYFVSDGVNAKKFVKY